MFYIYTVTSSVSGKVYVGRTKSPKRRWLCHRMYAKSGRGFALHQAMRDEVGHPFRFEIVAAFEDIAAAKAGERGLIAEFRSNHPDHGYNATSGGHDYPEVGRISAIKNAERAAADPVGEASRRSAAAKKAAAKMPADVRRENMRKARFSMGPERISDHIKAVTAGLSRDAREAKARKANETLGPQGRQDRARRAIATLGKEGLSARAKKSVAAQTPEQRSEARKRSWITRRANKAG